MKKSLASLRADGIQAYNARWLALASIAAAGLAPASSEAPNIITAINAAIAVESNYIEALTTYAVGWKPEAGLMELKNFIAPDRKVAERFEYEKLTNVEAFLSNVHEDLRAPRAEFKSVPPPTSTKVQDKTENRGLQIIVENRDVAAKGSQKYIGMLQERLFLNKLRRAIALLVAAANNTAVTWNSSADPDAAVKARLLAAAEESGLRPNRVLYGESAFDVRDAAYRAQNNAGGYASASFSLEQLARHLRVDEVQLAKARYASSESVRAEVLGSLVLCFSAIQNESLTDPTNVVDFWSPCDSGERVAVYQWPIGSKFTGFAVEHYEKLVAVSDLGLEKLTVSAS